MYHQFFDAHPYPHIVVFLKYIELSGGPSKITGISQYRWHKPSIFHERGEDELNGTVTGIWSEIQRIHGEVLAEARAGNGREMGEL